MSNKKNFSLVTLRNEIKKDTERPSFKAEIAEGVNVTFKNPASLPFFTFADIGEDVGSMITIFKNLLSEEDFEALKAAEPTTAEIGKIFEAVNEHYAEENEANSKS